MQNKVCGHIDCPTCGTAKGMRITLDKNKDPFGFCEANCGQQLRVGGNAHRVKQFIERYPFAKAGPVTVTVTEEKAPELHTVTVTEPLQAAKPKKPVTVPEPKKPEVKKAGWFTPLLGVDHG